MSGRRPETRADFIRALHALTDGLLPCQTKRVEAKFQIFLLLLSVLAGTAWLAKRVDIAPAILLLLVGIVLAFVPGMPTLELPPELVLLAVLPPLIYSASVACSPSAASSSRRRWSRPPRTT